MEKPRHSVPAYFSALTQPTKLRSLIRTILVATNMNGSMKKWDYLAALVDLPLTCFRISKNVFTIISEIQLNVAYQVLNFGVIILIRDP